MHVRSACVALRKVWAGRCLPACVPEVGKRVTKPIAGSAALYHRPQPAERARACTPMVQACRGW